MLQGTLDWAVVRATVAALCGTRASAFHPLWQHDAVMGKRSPLVVIVAYRNTCGLEAALQSMGAGHALFVVDNGADDDVRTLVRKYGGRYVSPGRNVGFAAAVNLALAERGGRDVLLLNPDAQVSPDLPRALTACLSVDPTVGAVAPRLRGATATCSASSGRFHRRGNRGSMPLSCGTSFATCGLPRRRRVDAQSEAWRMLGRSTSGSPCTPRSATGSFGLFVAVGGWSLRRVFVRSTRVAGVARRVGAGALPPRVSQALRAEVVRPERMDKHAGGVLDRCSASSRGQPWPTKSTDTIRSGATTLAGNGVRACRNNRLEIVHIVRSDSFAGVERYICGVANGLVSRGHRVRVIGGDPKRMVLELDESVRHTPAVSVGQAWLALAACGSASLVHAHMTAAEAAAVCCRFRHGAPVVSTRHFPNGRGSSAGGRLAGV